MKLLKDFYARNWGKVSVDILDKRFWQTELSDRV